MCSVCLFAYGQTGSGKTHTMQGPTGDPGINLRTLEALFQQASMRAHDAAITIHVSMVEVSCPSLSSQSDVCCRAHEWPHLHLHLHHCMYPETEFQQWYSYAGFSTQDGAE